MIKCELNCGRDIKRYRHLYEFTVCRICRKKVELEYMQIKRATMEKLADELSVTRKFRREIGMIYLNSCRYDGIEL